MIVKEILSESEEEKLAALGQYMIGRANNQNAPS